MANKITCTCGHSWNKSSSSKKDTTICHICGKNVMKNGGWLDKYDDGGSMQEHQENYNDSDIYASPDMLGDGFSNVGRNYSPAWGGQFQEGGEIPQAQNGLWKENKKAFVDSTLNANKHLDFVKRLYDQSKGSIQIPGQPGRSTHFMADDATRVYPTVVNKNNKLQYLGGNHGDEAWDYADKTGEYINFKTPEQASWFANSPNHSTGYKMGTNVLTTIPRKQMGGTIAGAPGFSYARTGSIPKAQWGTNTGDIASLPGVRKEIPFSKEQLAKNKKEVEERTKAENAKTIADRKTRIKASEEAKKKPFSAKTLAEQTQAIGDKFRFFPNDPNSFIDDYLNPGVMLGGMASGLGSVPYDMQQGNYGQVAMSVVSPLAVGAFAGIGANNTKQFVNNLVNPLSGINLKQGLKGAVEFLTEDTALRNAYKYNPYAFKPNPEAVYRQMGEPGYQNAIQEGRVLAKGQKEFLEENPGFNYWDEYNKFMDYSNKTRFNLKKPAVAPFFQKGELFFPISNKTGFGRGKTAASDVKYLFEGKLPEEAIVPRYRDQYLTNEVFNRNAIGGIGVLDPKYSDLSNFNIYQKHWLQGYKEVPKPTSVAASQIEKKKNGGIIKDDRGQWDHPGEITEIGSNQITMEGVPYPLLGISDTGDTKMMYPGEDYKFKGKKVVEYPVAKEGDVIPPKTKTEYLKEKLAAQQEALQIAQDAQSMKKKDWEAKYKSVLSNDAKIKSFSGISSYDDFKNNIPTFNSRIKNYSVDLKNFERQVAQEQSLIDQSQEPSSYIKNYLNQYNTIEDIKKAASTKYGYNPSQQLDPLQFVSNNMVKEANERISTNKGFPLYQDPTNEMTCINGVCSIAADQGVDFSNFPHGEGTGVRQDAQGRWIPQYNPTFSQNYEKAGYRILDANEAPQPGDVSQYYEGKRPHHAEIVLSRDDNKINTFNNYQLTNYGNGLSTREFDPNQDSRYDIKDQSDTKYYRLTPESAEKAAMKNPEYFKLAEGKKKFESSDENKQYQESSKFIQNKNANLLGEDAPLFDEIVSGARGKYAKDKPGLISSLSAKSKNPKLLEKIINQSYKNGGWLEKYN